VTSALAVPLYVWLVFGTIVLVSLALDLVTHRGGHGLSRKSAIIWSVVWIAVALGFAGWIGINFGSSHAQTFVSAYLMEKSLSIDNLFVFMVVFGRLQIPPAEQHRVLFWGILGALVFRAAFIAAGTALLSTWHDVVYVLGVFLIYTAYRTLRTSGHEHGETKLLGALRRNRRTTHELHGHKFFVKEKGIWVGTPLVVALIAIELSDIMFALDSVPAVFAVTEEPFIVYSSNVFAILGMRALYLVLADLLRDLHYLRYGLAGILALAGVKMLVSDIVHIPHTVSLALIVAILAAAIIASIIYARHHEHESHA
jgi:tellurite resistance protein TerC